MNLSDLLSLLSQPSSYPDQADNILVIQTHISLVFLTPQFAYKIKKPVDLGFLDFSTLDKRRHLCQEEVRLNRRLAPDVYLGVVPVTATGIEKDGEPLEWAVKMRRLPDEATLQKRLLRGELDEKVLTLLAKRLAEFHASAQRGPEISSFGRFDVVAGNARENFTQAQSAVGTTIHPAVFERLRLLTEERLTLQRPVIEGRAERGVPCDTHGDLHLDHIYYFPEETAPRDLVIVDCIEFNDRFRYADPTADAAFVAMDLKFHGRRDLAWAFYLAYLEASKDSEAGKLFRFYTAYRAAIRAKVDGIKALEPEVPADQRQRALARGRAHWLLALVELEPPSGFPCLILIAGLPGSGKSTLAQRLCENHGRVLLQSDRIRKELAAPLAGDAIYTQEWNDRTYGDCLRRAEELLFKGKTVVVDANFREDAKRRQFLECGLRWGVPTALLVCKVDDDVARHRLASRKGEISDADWEVRQRLASQWDPLSVFCQRYAFELSAWESQDSVVGQALEIMEHLWF